MFAASLRRLLLNGCYTRTQARRNNGLDWGRYPSGGLLPVQQQPSSLVALSAFVQTEDHQERHRATGLLTHCAGCRIFRRMGFTSALFG